MSGPAEHPAQQPAAQHPQASMQLRRRLSIGSWAIISFLLLSFAAAAVSLLAPVFFDNLPGILAFIAAQPLLLRIPLYLWLLLAPVLLWLLWRAQHRARQAAEQEERKEHLAEQRDTFTRVVSEQAGVPLQAISRTVTATHQELEELTQRLERTARALPSEVIAPTGLPLAISLVGRDALLAELMAALRAGDAIGVFALEGMGGVGKTALAAEIVARLAEEQNAFPGGAAWIACEGLEGEAGLADLWARVARALRLEQVAALPDPLARSAALAAALAQCKRLLLALDNLEPGLDADAALDTLSIRGHTALLLTARQKVAPQRLRAVELAPLPPPDGASLFRQRLG